MLVTEALSELMAAPGKGDKPVAFLLDEMAALGEMQVLATAFQLARGYGIQMYGFLQNLNDLQESWGKRWESFFGNTTVAQFFTPNDAVTAKYIADRCGVRTSYIRSESFSTGANNQSSSSTSYNVTQTPLVYPQELYDLAGDLSIVFHAGFGSPISVSRFPYFEPDKRFPGVTDYTGLHDPNPYLEGRTQSHDDTNGVGEDDDAEQQPKPDKGAMTSTEARKWLGLQKGATKEQLNAAWRSVLKQVHGDIGRKDFVNGGVESAHRDYLTRQVNQARDVLLRELGV
jgi:type IV secretory pathway TraG/TraD family ATPase VirD4